MNQKNLWIAAVSGAVFTTLFSNLPIIGVLNCVVCAWFWAGGVLAVWLYRRLNGQMPDMRQGLIIGALSGVLAGAMGFALSFAGLAGLQGMVKGLPPEATSGIADMPAWGPLVFNMAGVIFNILFGTLGGWLGVTIFKRGGKPAQA